MANEKRLIDANVFAEHLERMTRTAYPNLFPGLLEAIDYARDFPTVEAVEVVHGRWLGTHDGWYYSYSCSECGAEALTKEETMHDQVCSNFCPNCGADMRERKDNDL